MYVLLIECFLNTTYTAQIHITSDIRDNTIVTVILIKHKLVNTLTHSTFSSHQQDSCTIQYKTNADNTLKLTLVKN